MLNYLLENWIAIVALVISLVSLITGIVTRYEAKQVQIEEKNGELKNKIIKTSDQIIELASELKDLKEYHDKVLKLLIQQNNTKSGNISPQRVRVTKAFIDLGSDVEKSLLFITKAKSEIDIYLEKRWQKKMQSLPQLAQIIAALNNFELIINSSQEECSGWRKIIDDMTLVVKDESL